MRREPDWSEAIPKLELHLHLEGAIPHEALWQLIRKYGGDSTVPDRAAIESKFQYRDFPDFIRTWLWKNTFLREYEDFAFVAEAVARSLAEHRVPLEPCPVSNLKTGAVRRLEDHPVRRYFDRALLVTVNTHE